jgi:WD40-like Beta Propeller Repeat
VRSGPAATARIVPHVGCSAPSCRDRRRSWRGAIRSSRDHRRGCSRLLVSAWMALIAAAAPGCLGDDDQRAPATATPSVGAPRAEPLELVVFRAPGTKTVRYELVASGADGGFIRVLVGGTERDRLRPALFERAAWSPDGRRLAFTAELGELADFPMDIYVVRADGSGRPAIDDGRAQLSSRVVARRAANLLCPQSQGGASRR